MQPIDWSKAPEGFDVHIQWESGGGFFYQDEGHKFTRKGGRYAFKHDVEEMGAVVTRRPWNGEGVPPVGIDVEFCVAGDSRWIEGEVLYSSLYTVVISGNGFEHVRHPNILKFRPIRTPEQIAAEEREQGIERMIDAALIAAGTAFIREREQRIIEALYDAGCRMQVAE